MNHKTATVKVGLLTIISLTVLITTVIWLRGRGLGGGHHYAVLFKDINGLRDGAAVQLMGIRVGYIDSVDPVMLDGKKYRVKLRFTITEPHVKIPRGATLSLQQAGFIGEQFLEITPPRSAQSELTLSADEPFMQPNLPIKVAFKGGMVTVGHIQGLRLAHARKLSSTSPISHYEFMYLVDQPGYMPPSKPEFQLVKSDPSQPPYLLMDDTLAAWEPRPDASQYFSIEEPLRLKDFLEEQLASAEALKDTNQKLNNLLSDETITAIQGTMKNSQRLTAEAVDVLNEAKHLFSSTSSDLHSLVASANQLSVSVTKVSNNVNAIAGDPKTQANLRQTVNSLNASTAELSELLQDPNLKGVVGDLHVTSQNAAEIMAYLKKTTVDDDLQGKINTSLTLLNTSLNRLSTILGEVQPNAGDKDSIQAILHDTHDAAKNLDELSKRLNHHFLLFHTLF